MNVWVRQEAQWGEDNWGQIISSLLVTASMEGVQLSVQLRLHKWHLMTEYIKSSFAPVLNLYSLRRGTA
jgi:hypothetical protein